MYNGLTGYVYFCNSDGRGFNLVSVTNGSFNKKDADGVTGGQITNVGTGIKKYTSYFSFHPSKVMATADNLLRKVF